MRNVPKTLHFFIGIALGSAVLSAQSPRYAVHDLGANANVTGINIIGEVIGSTPSSSGGTTGFRTKPNRSIDLPGDDIGTLGGTTTSPAAINSFGQVAGTATNSSGETRAFRTGPNRKINPSTDDLGSLGGPAIFGTVRSQASGINDLGQVVGGSSSPVGILHAFETRPESAINPATDDVGARPFAPVPANQQSSGRSVNAFGAVAGTFLGGQNTFPTTFVFQNGTITEVPCFIIAPFGNNISNINNLGQVAGTNACSTSFPPNISIWQGGNLTNLFACDCEPHGLNDFGQIVGRGFGFGPNHAFVYRNGKLLDLNNLIPANSGWVLTNAVAINDLGQIVGTGQLNGSPHAFRLDPATP